jgi:hypothetical protein
VKELLNVAIKRERVIKMLATVFSRIDCMRPSEYAELFYAECERRGAKYVCQNKNCGLTQEWDGKRCETKHCESKEKACNGIMLIIINGEGAEKVAEPEIEKKVCPGGRTDVKTGKVMIVEIITREERCLQSDGCRFFIRGREFHCKCYKPKNDLRI